MFLLINLKYINKWSVNQILIKYKYVNIMYSKNKLFLVWVLSRQAAHRYLISIYYCIFILENYNNIFK